MFEGGFSSKPTRMEKASRNEPFNGDAGYFQVDSVRGSIFQNISLERAFPSDSQDNVFLNAYQKRITSSGDQVVIGSDTPTTDAALYVDGDVVFNDKFPDHAQIGSLTLWNPATTILYYRKQLLPN